MHARAHEERFDITARRFHQAMLVALLVAGYVLGAGIGRWLVLLVALVMLLGRYWDAFDIFRLLAWKVLEPAGILRPHLAPEDRAGRRAARVLGGLALLAAVALLSSFATLLGWLVVWLLVLMIALDAAVSF